MEKIDNFYKELYEAVEQNDFDATNKISSEIEEYIKSATFTVEEWEYAREKAKEVATLIEKKMKEIKELLIEQNKNQSVAQKYEND